MYGYTEAFNQYIIIRYIIISNFINFCWEIYTKTIRQLALVFCEFYSTRPRLVDYLSAHRKLGLVV